MGAADVIEETGVIVNAIPSYESGACAGLTRNENVATQSCEVGRRILVDGPSVHCQQEVGTVRAEGARIVRDDDDAFRTGPGKVKNIRSNSMIALDCVDLTVALVGYPDLAAQGPEALRHDSWSFHS